MKELKERDLPTLNLFAILAVLTILFVLGSRVVLFAPLNEPVKVTSPDAVEAGK
jgi:hypothetical protein